MIGYDLKTDISVINSHFTQRSFSVADDAAWQDVKDKMNDFHEFFQQMVEHLNKGEVIEPNSFAHAGAELFLKEFE